VNIPKYRPSFLRNRTVTSALLSSPHQLVFVEVKENIFSSKVVTKKAIEEQKRITCASLRRRHHHRPRRRCIALVLLFIHRVVVAVFANVILILRRGRFRGKG